MCLAGAVSIASTDLRPGSVAVAFGPLVWTIEPGERMSFGRGRDDAPVDIVVSADLAMHGRAGEVVANPSGWELVNTGRWLPITVQDGLTRKAFVVEPGETHPFLLAEATIRLVLRTAESIETVELEVRTASGRDIVPPPAVGGDTVRPVDGPTGVKRTAKYYRVLVELCRPRLEDPSNVTPPSAKELRARLDPVEYPTVRGVEKHLETLTSARRDATGRTGPSSNAPAEAMSVDPEVQEALDAAHTVDRLQLVVDHPEQRAGLFGDDLDEQVEAARRQHDVDDAVNGGNGVGDAHDIAVDLDAEHCHHGVAEGQRIGHTDNVDDAGIQQPLDALTSRGRREPDARCQVDIGDAAVTLQLGDDRLVGLVEGDGRAVAAIGLGHAIPAESPKSIETLAPVIGAACGWHRYQTSSATSSTRMNRAREPCG